MTKTIKEVALNLDHLSPSTEALMFSIYFATITSMSGEEVMCPQYFHKPEVLTKIVGPNESGSQ